MPAKQRMEGVSAASMAKRRYPSLMKGKADPHSTLHRIASSTANSGVPKILSSFSARESVALPMAQWMRAPTGVSSL